MQAAISAVAIGFLVLIVSATLFFPKQSLSQGVGTALNGYGWSDTIGWISFSCANTGSCGTNNYGIAIAADGALSGYGWSDTIGWVSANSGDLTGCPAAPCTARMDNFSAAGWLKALSANNAESGSWDGFISLSGAGYGPTLSNGAYSGYAWGDTVVGWMSFSYASTTWVPTCSTTYMCMSTTTRQNQCPGSVVESCGGNLICSQGDGSCVTPPAPFTSPGDELTISPLFIAYGDTVSISWDVQEADNCVLTEDNPTIVDAWEGIAVSSSSSSLTQATTYTLTCTGPGGELVQRATVSRRPDWREI